MSLSIMMRMKVMMRVILVTEAWKSGQAYVKNSVLVERTFALLRRKDCCAIPMNALALTGAGGRLGWHPVDISLF